jgi:amidase
MQDYEDLDATAMAALVRERQVAPDHFVKEAQARIRALNPALNAVVHDIAPEYHAGPEAPFAGVPLLLKNTGVAVRGAPVTSGSALFADVVSPADSTLAARLRKAGFVFIGRTNTPEMALSFTTEGAFHGPARNPWDLGRSPGGSSGGAAAAVAAGIVPVAQSSDGAGSTRVPAAHCGVFGFKPTRLRNPVGPAQAEGIGGMSTPHAITRTVRDSAWMLDATHGPDLGDPWACPAPQGRFVDAVARPPGRLRIGMQVAGDPDCRAAVLATAAMCEDLGHHVTLAAPEYDNAALAAAWFTVSAVSVARGVGAHARARGLNDPLALMEPINAEWVLRGRAISGDAYLGAVQFLHSTSRSLGRFFQTQDVFLSPTTAEIAPPLGWLAGAGLDVDVFFDRFWAHAPLTAVFNASGCPAMSLPLHQTASGLPVGVQFGAAFGADELLFALAGQIELAAPWVARRPALAVAA